MTGERLGNYEVLEKLGEGGMGEVWRARDERLNRLVALKVLPPAVSGDPDRAARFEREARTLAALNHPNIVAIYDTGTENGRSYLVSELVEGESLRAVIDRGPVPPRKLLEYAIQIADAIAAAHAVGIVHRDLKPENIMLSHTGRVKVLDFGLAKQTIAPTNDRTATLALSQPGTVMGTVGYMSPEQVRGEPVDHRSDIFSFGAVLYEMITGKRAFAAGSSVETMHAILHADPPEFDSALPGMPPALATVVRRCLEKAPAERFQSAADLAFALRSIAPGSATASHGAVSGVSKPSGGHYLRAAAGLLSAAALFGAGYFVRNATVNREPPHFQRITFRTGLVTNARFTADARNIIYGAKWDNGPARVYLATPGSPDSRDLDLPDGSMLAAVSSKDEIAFLAGPFTPQGTGTLSRGSISGGRMRPALEGVVMADWGPDGQALAVLRTVNGRYRLEYPIGKALSTDMEWPLQAIRISPDGSQVAIAQSYQGSSIALSVINTSGKLRFLGAVSDQSPNRIDSILCWSPNGREIWFRSYDPREWGTLYAMDMKGHRRVLARVPGHVTLYDVARDGRLLLRTDSRQVGILGLAPGDKEERDLSCLDASTLNGISADGHLIAASIVGESGGPKGSIYVRKTDGSPPVRVGDGAAFAISPDGQWISSFSSTDSSTRRYVLLPTGAGEEREVSISALKNQNVVFGWAPGGKTLFVGAPSGGSGFKNYAWTPATNELRPVGGRASDGIRFVSPDCKHILTPTPEGWSDDPVDGGASKALSVLSPHDTPVGWRADNRSVYVVTHHDENKNFPVSILDTVTGTSRPWKEIRPARPVEQVLNLHVTPDGNAYAYNYIVKTSDLYAAGGIH